MVTCSVTARWARWVLGTIAIVQIAIALPILLFGSEVAASLHIAHELASWEVALAVGFGSRASARSGPPA